MSKVESTPQQGDVDVVMSRQGAKKDMLLPIGDSTVIVQVGHSRLRWTRDPSLEEGNLHVEFRDGRSPFANNALRVNQDALVPVVNGGFFTYDVFLNKANGQQEVFRGGGGVEAKPKGG